MKFIISSSALFSRLQSIGRVINSKNTLPILDCFLFEIKDNTLTTIASDSETTLVTSVSSVETDSDMRFCINAKTIQDSMKWKSPNNLWLLKSTPTARRLRQAIRTATSTSWALRPTNTPK